MVFGFFVLGSNKLTLPFIPGSIGIVHGEWDGVLSNNDNTRKVSDPECNEKQQ